MSALENLEAFAYSYLRRLAAPVRHHLHRRPTPIPEIDERRLAQASATWWGSEPRWYPIDAPPRLHNRLTPLIDGDRYFRALLDEIGKAQRYIYILGWCLTPHIALQRDPAAIRETRLLELLAERSYQIPVRILLWRGDLALLQPTRRTVNAIKRTIEEHPHGDLQCRLDGTAHFTHCHHQKAVVVDGQIGFVGGMDLTTFEGDRWDRQDHPLRSGPNWHDVQLRVEGEAATDIEQNFRQRWLGSTGEAGLPHQEPHYEESWQTPVQIVRTIPKGVYDFASKGIFGIRHVYLETLRRAQRLIYLENQYLWSPEIMQILAGFIQDPPSEQFRIVILLPAGAHSGKWDNDQHVAHLRELDRERGIVSIYCPYASGASAGRDPFRYRPTYLHAKVAIVDDAWILVGSANLNDRGFISDSEIDALVHDPELTRALRVDLWSEHLVLPREQVDQKDPVALIDQDWRGRAEENARIIEQGDQPLLCAVHRYEVGHMPGSWLMEEAEVLTFEH